jgi:hypothetical protein
MMRVSQEARGEVLVLVDGTFDRAQASRLQGVFREAGEGEHVVVDFSHVREMHEVELAAVARGMTGTAARVELRGLARHQERVLRYMGVDLGGDGADPRS